MIGACLRIAGKAGLVTLLAAGGWGGRAERQEGVATMIEYDVSPEREDYSLGENVEVRVEIVNRGQEPVDVPDPTMAANTQPTHWVSGPGLAEEIPFTNSRRLSAGEQAAEPTDQKLLTIAAGATWSTAFALNRVVKLSEPGEYRLRSQLAFQRGKAKSKESSFRMGPLELSSIHLGLGVRPFESGEGEGAFIRRGSGGYSLYTFEFREMRPGIGEAFLGKPISRTPVGAGATDVAVPWRNTSFFDEILRWIVWREGRAVKAVSSVMETPLSFDLPAEPAYLVRPPLKTAGGPVEVLAVTKDRTAVELVTISGQPGEEPKAKLAWTAKLPAAAIAATAVLGPPASGSDRHLTFVALRDRGFEIFHAHYKQGGVLADFRSARVESGRPLAGASPAIFVEPDGGVRVSMVAALADDERSGMVAEAVFPAGGKPPLPTRLTPFEHLAAKPAKAAILYVDKEGTLLRRDTVLALDNGELLKLSPSGLAPLSSHGATTAPILLAPGKNTTYIIFIDPVRGLYVEYI